MKIKDLIEVLDLRNSTLFYVSYVLKTKEYKSTYFCGYVSQMPKFLYDYEIAKVFLGKYIDIRCK